MSSIKDFFNNRSQTKKAEDMLHQHKTEVNNLEQNLKKYQNLSQQELMNELFKEASRLKQNGNLTADSLQALKQTLAPMLSAEQNQQLNSIINQLK